MPVWGSKGKVWRIGDSHTRSVVIDATDTPKHGFVAVTVYTGELSYKAIPIIPTDLDLFCIQWLTARDIIEATENTVDPSQNGAGDPRRATGTPKECEG